jgi:hypothetical protein
MGIVSSHGVGNPIPHIPNRKERSKRAKEAGLFKHKGAWQHVNQAAYEQRDQAINKRVHREIQKMNAEAKEQGDATKN